MRAGVPLRLRVRAGCEAAPWVIKEIDRLEFQRDQAIVLLRAVLDTKRDASQAWTARREAELWLRSQSNQEPYS